MLSLLKDITKKVWSVRFIRYILVGVINTIFGYGVFALLIYAGIFYKTALIISTSVGVLFNFMTVGKIVFNNDRYYLIVKYVVGYGFIYFVNVFLLKHLINTGLNTYYSQMLCLPVIVVIAFLLNKHWVFK